MSSIGTLAENSLHAALKVRLGRSGDRFEVNVDGFVVDILRGEQLIEIQTQHLYAMKRKLHQLLPHHPVHVVHPIPQDKWIVRITEAGEQVSRRLSPKHGRFLHLFDELVRMPSDLLHHPNLTIEVLLTQEEEVWRDDGQGSWRRQGWSIYDRRLLDVGARRQFVKAADFTALLPDALPDPFTNRQLADLLECRTRLARRITYTLRQINTVALVGKRGQAHLHVRV